MPRHASLGLLLMLAIALFSTACALADEAAPRQVTTGPDSETEPALEATQTSPAKISSTAQPVASPSREQATAGLADSSSNSQTEAGAPPTRKPASTYADLEIVTLLPRDAIPAIDNPQFLSAEEADAYYDPEELVMGVSFNGDARAYSAPFLSGHEIVNDTVGGVKIAVTW